MATFKKFKESQWYGIVILVLMAVLFWAVFKVLSPRNFGTWDKVLIYVKTAFIYAVGGCGLYFICVMGPFDFSIGANIVLSSIIAVTASAHFGYAGLIIAPILSGTLIGLINGVVYMQLQISSLIVTVGLSLIYEALGLFAVAGKEQVLGNGLRAFGDYPWNIVAAFTAYFISAFLLKYTKMGTYSYAIGSNEVIAKNMGVNVKKYKILAFTLCGFLVGLQSILTISYGTSISAASNLSSMSRNFTPLMGAFFGLAFRKYGHPIIAIVIGEIIISLMFNGFVAMGAPTTIQNVITGMALLIIVTVTTKPVKGRVVK